MTSVVIKFLQITLVFSKGPSGNFSKWNFSAKTSSSFLSISVFGDSGLVLKCTSSQAVRRKLWLAENGNCTCTMITGEFPLHPLQWCWNNNLSFDLDWPWSSSNLFKGPAHSTEPLWCLSGVCRVREVDVFFFLKVTLVFRTWNSTETDLTLTKPAQAVCRWLMSVSSSFSNSTQTRRLKLFQLHFPVWVTANAPADLHVKLLLKNRLICAF